MAPRLFLAPANAPPTERHNWLATQKEAVAFGPTVAVAALVGVYAVSLAGIEMALFDALLKAVPAGQIVRFAAFDSGFANLAAMIGPILGAVISAAIGIPGGLVAASVVASAGAALCIASVTADRRRRSTDPTARRDAEATEVGKAAGAA